jgi:uncharacterized protein YcnI
MTAKRTVHACGWLGVTAAVALLARATVYSFAPRGTPLSARLAAATGGPSLTIELVACALALALSVAMLGTAVVAVAERRQVEPLAMSTSPGVCPWRVAWHTLVLLVASSIVFTLIESYVHWRAGLGWHGQRCLTGPVHRDALPFLAAFSLLATAAIAAGRHVLAWFRRAVGRLVGGAPSVAPALRKRLAPALEVVLRRHEGVRPLGARAPPSTFLVRAGGIACRLFPSDKESARMPVSNKLRVAVLALTATVGLVVVAGAFAHAEVSPPVAMAKAGQVFTLAVPTEEEGATTTTVELTPPAGFAIDSFAPSPGWKREVKQTGKGEEAVIQQVTWSGGSVPTGEDALFQFIATPESATTYTFAVRQTYSNGKVVDWSGSESSDTPAPTIEAKDSLGGGSSTLTIVALVLGGVGVALGLVALLAGRRTLA